MHNSTEIFYYLKKIELHSMTSAVADAQCTVIIWACAVKGEGCRKEEEGGVRREVKCKCVLCLVVFAHVDLPPSRV